MKTILQMLISGGAVYLLINLYALLISDRLIFAPRSTTYQRLPNEVKISTSDGEQITAVYLAHPEPACTLLFSHGNAEDLGNVVPFMEQFYERGCSVLMYDYRGYGTSDGRPSTARAKEDAMAAYRWLVDTQQIDPKTIVSHGRSLGGAVAVWLAAKADVGGVISEISFASAFRVKTRWKLLLLDKFDSLKSIPRVNCPVLVIHGTDDGIIPFRHAEQIYNAAEEPKRHLWIEGGDHYDYVYIDEKAYFDAIEGFIKEMVNSQ